MGVLFLGFTATCAALAIAVAFVDSRRLYVVVECLCGLATLTYAATRLVAFPQLADDVGNRSETLGVISVAGEVGVVALAVQLIRTSTRDTTSPLAEPHVHH